MSSIVIAGDTSGTVTLQAPAVAGSTTVNLPSTPGNNGASAVVTTNASGNLGLGVTPSANWQSARRALQISATAGGASIHSAANSQAVVGANNVFNGTNYLYLASDTASRYEQLFGAHAWYTAPSGTAGNAISFTQAMTLDASGNLGVGTTSPAWKLDVNGIVTSRSDSLSGMRFQTSANGYNGFVLYETSSNSIIVNNYNAGPITFKTSDAERARITSGGNFGIATSTPTSTLHTAGAIRIGGSGGSGTNGSVSLTKTGANSQTFDVTMSLAGGNDPGMIELTATQNDYSGANSGFLKAWYYVTQATVNSTAVNPITNGSTFTVSFSNLSGTSYRITVAGARQQMAVSVTVLGATNIT